ncbi:Rad4-domain-containing protein [Parathielavia appendiculata]|uniref:Rad4-domain-containing protein n=1 Tax=Parathielavia appendiculata TaxID=2587402 RepID=A0AAN6Z6Y2_9PEZI|nr:Rad4-domain-containing protein [Parathielavia appendiculata]
MDTGIAVSHDASEDGNIQFEDVVIPTPTVQTVLRDSDDEEDDDIFEDVAIEPAVPSAAIAGEGFKALNLDLSAHMAAMGPRRADRRKALSNEERERRVEAHKVHLVCLLAHLELRNRWCNDPEVQETLRPLLPQKTVSALVPRASLNQFGRSESLKKGLQEAKELFKMAFSITERGLWRALWAGDEEQLKNYQLPDDMESTLDKSDFLEAARRMQGSRDVGAQLFCALLRSVGVQARLVCSLQPLPFVPGAPSMPKQRKASTPQNQPSKAELYAAAVAKHETKFPEFQAGATTPSPRRRLGHPHAAAYHIPSVTASSHSPSQLSVSTPRMIRGESPFPVYWVEVLDVAHQKWHPVDPLVTCTQCKPRALEPPPSDTLNNLTYTIAFAADSSAVDVTRRYAKAYTSKTRKQRIDGFPTTLNPTTSSGSSSTNLTGGARWYRRLLSRYTRPLPTDLEQIELNELAAEEAREPMPRNVADFKDHPVYALERHLRRHEVLVPGAQPSGTVSAGAKAGAQLERIYRRKDVRVARTREKWYRLGRVVRDGEEPVKSLPKRKVRRKGGGFESDEDGKADGAVDDPDRVGLFGDAALGYVPLYMMEQTDAYVAPPVVDGRVPKNKFGNIDLYVPSMVPRGGVHIRHDRAAQAAFILGLDYAPALTGFEFRGRQGTAVLNGVVVPEEAEEAVSAVVQGLVEMEAEEEQERRSRRALRMWSRFLKELRIRERIWAGVDVEVEAEEEPESKRKGKEAVLEEDVWMEGDPSEDDTGGGGFFVPDEDDEDDGGSGGFIVE